MTEQEKTRVRQWFNRAKPWLIAYGHVYFALVCISVVVLFSTIFLGIRSAGPETIGLRPLPYPVRLAGMTALVIVTTPLILVAVVSLVGLTVLVVWKAANGLYGQFKQAVDEVREHD